MLYCCACAGNVSAARVFALGKLGCFVPFDSTQQAVLDEKHEALDYHVEPSHPPPSAINIDKEREPSPRHRLLKAKIIVCLLSAIVQYVCAGMCVHLHAH